MTNNSRHYFLQPLLMLALSSLLPACRKHVEEKSRVSYIIDSDSIENLTPQHFEKYERAINSTVLIVTRLSNGSSKFCSGSYLTPQTTPAQHMILTNHHCFATAEDASQSQSAYIENPGLLPEACSQTTVLFGYHSDKYRNSNINEIKCKLGSLHTDRAADLAVFQLESEPTEAYKGLEISHDATLINRAAVIVHYPDHNHQKSIQNMNGSEIALPVPAITRNDCTTIGEFDSSLWNQEQVLTFSVGHNCDLTHGSSGSALVDQETGKILGVNWGGVKLKSGQILEVHNAAIKADVVAAFLQTGKAAASEDSSPITANSPKIGQQQVASTQKANSSHKGCGVINSNPSQTLPSLAFLLSLLAPLLAVVVKFIKVKKS